MTVPDASIAVRTPIVVRAGTLLLTNKLLIVSAMSLSDHLQCGSYHVKNWAHSGPRPFFVRQSSHTYGATIGLDPKLPIPDADLHELSADDDPLGSKATQPGGA